MQTHSRKAIVCLRWSYHGLNLKDIRYSLKVVLSYKDIFTTQGIESIFYSNYK